MVQQRSDLPFGSEFSPSQIELPELLQIVKDHDGDVKGLQAAIQARFFSTHGGGDAKNQKTLAMNSRLGLKAYGIIDEAGSLTTDGGYCRASSEKTTGRVAISQNVTAICSGE